MAVVDETVPYEILIRFNDYGEPRGGHARYLRRVVLDGELLKVEVGPAEPIDLAGFPVSGLMTAVQVSALAQVTRLTAQVEALMQERDALAAQVEALTAQVAASL